MTDLISRFSSHKKRLSRVFLKDRLQGAETYDRIAGYFRSSIFDLIHEEISSIGRVRIICNADLDPRDLTAAKLSERAREQAQVERWHEQGDGIDALLERPRWRQLHEILTTGNLEIRVVSRDNAPFLHGKAGVITCSDGTTSSFIGSINETASGWEHSYEMVWEDRSEAAAKWVQIEFDWLWDRGVPLAQAVIDEIGRTADKVEVLIKELKDNPLELAKSILVESPLARNGEKLAPWQKEFVRIFIDHDQKYGAARLLLADEVGVGKTLSMASVGALSVLMEHGPTLILCPATLIWQWQMELWDKLGLPSCVWGRAPQKGWVDHHGHLYRSSEPDDIRRCPAQIGIVSTGVLTHGKEEAKALLRGRFGMVALDEGHKARIKRSMGKEKPTKLYTAMKKLGNQTNHLIIATATPIQTDNKEIWDLMKLLARKREHVLGREGSSRWWNSNESLDLITGKTTLSDIESVWPWLRTPLPYRKDARVFAQIRNDLELDDDVVFTDCGISDTNIEDGTRHELRDMLEEGESDRNIPFMQFHNPLGRHVILRRRKTLEDAGLMDRIMVDIHPEQGAAPGIFDDLAVRTPDFYDRAYDEVDLFTMAMRKRKMGIGFLGILMMQRICSSVAAGRTTALRMLENRRIEIDSEQVDDPDLLEAMDGIDIREFNSLMDNEARHLERVLKVLDGQKDPKGDAVLHYLDKQKWLDLGCIVFSQYYDTIRWIAGLISETHINEPVAVYAGADKSGLLLNKEWRSVNREDIKQGIREYKLRIVCATDAACEGLNLQSLGTLVNVDLPWNPSRLEQRLGRIKRYGQQRESVDMANLVYAGTVDERVYQKLSERMKDRYDVLGSIPDTIRDYWIDSIEQKDKELEKFTRPESPADLFSLRYGDLSGNKDDREWEIWTKVVARRDIEAQLMKPWNRSGSKNVQ